MTERTPLPVKPAAAIFDWDGVVVDSSGLHTLSWERLARLKGRSLPEDLLPRIGSLGMKTEAVVSDLLGWAKEPEAVRAVTREKEAVFRSLAAELGLAPQPGLRRILASLREHGIPCAIGSSAPRLNIEDRLDHMGLRPFFPVVVCGDDAPRGKPAPDIFLLAAARLGVPPAQCVVFEDAPAGVAAARAAGMRVIAVLTTHRPDALREADRLVNGFDALAGTAPQTWLNPAKG